MGGDSEIGCIGLEWCCVGVGCSIVAVISFIGLLG